ncbi:MAG: hypothetical protein WCL38_06200 [Actinomycetota bacterium]
MGLVIGPDRLQVLEHQIGVEMTRRGPLPGHRIQVDHGVGDASSGELIIDLDCCRGLSNTRRSGDEKGRHLHAAIISRQQ